jgi:hypothetical protein
VKPIATFSNGFFEFAVDPGFFSLREILDFFPTIPENFLNVLKSILPVNPKF